MGWGRVLDLKADFSARLERVGVLFGVEVLVPASQPLLEFPMHALLGFLMNALLGFPMKAPKIC